MTQKRNQKPVFVYSTSILMNHNKKVNVPLLCNLIHEPEMLFSTFFNRNLQVETRFMCILDLLSKYHNHLVYEEYCPIRDVRCVIDNDKDFSIKVLRRAFDYTEIIIGTLIRDKRVLHEKYYELAITVMAEICQLLMQTGVDVCLSTQLREKLPCNIDEYMNEEVCWGYAIDDDDNDL